MEVIFVALLGAVFGSFVGAFSYRAPRGVSVLKGRSSCPSCKSTIGVLENFPVVSYVLLGGKCRNCKKTISLRYPLIEIVTAFLFVAIFLNMPKILLEHPWITPLGFLALPFLLALTTLLVVVFVIDVEHFLIPDSLSFALLGLVAIAILVAPNTYARLASGFFAGSAFLVLYLLTRGRGMGLGDAKLSLFMGVFLGFHQATVWFFLSFVLGATAGVSLMIASKKGLKDKIAFGPFMIVSFFIMLFWGKMLSRVILPYDALFGF